MHYCLRWFFIWTLVLYVNSFTGTVDAKTQGFVNGKILAAKSQSPDIASWKALPRSVGTYRNEYLNASTNLARRIGLAEQIGEEGAMVLARQQKWNPLLTQNDKFVRQGFDQVYRRGPKIIVVEAKGGSSQLGCGYGHPQGTREWAVGAAERTISNNNASVIERKVADQVLRAHQRGRLEVYTVRTEHVLGKPTQTFIEYSASGKIPEHRAVTHGTARVTAKTASGAAKMSNMMFARGVGLADVAYSGYRLRNTVSRRYEFDDGIFYAKTGVQGTTLTLGLTALAAPELFATKVTAIALLTTSAALVATDIFLDRAHETRVSDRRRLLDNLDAYEKHDAVDSLLRKMIGHDGMVLY